MQSAPGSRPAGPLFDSQDEALPRQFGKYTLLRRLATGGMAQLYLALQRAVAGFEKLVVIKCILPELTRDQAFIEMLLSEARTAATLSHPNVVQTFDVGEVEGTYYIAMEHINGEDIRSIVRAMKRAGVTELPLEHTLGIMLGVCAGLAYAHDKRDLSGNPLDIVHRDVSPQNVLITFSGDVKLVDFGIAKSTEAAVGERTAAGQLKGKVPYMSPEQARGLPLDHRSDIFSVGIMLFELTTGRRLFKAKSEYETLKLICDRDYPRPSDVAPGYSPALERVVMKALEKEPHDRYQSAADVQADLEAVVREERIPVSAVSLAGWMKLLFEEKIASQKEALQDVKHLADVIASQHSDPGDMFHSTGGVGASTGIATLDTDSAVYGRLEPPRSPARWVVLGAIALAAGAAGLYLLLDRGVELTAQAVPTVSATAAPVKKKGSLRVTSDPPGCYIHVAGSLHDQTTPATIEELPLGLELKVKLQQDGYVEHVARVTLTEGDPEQDLEVKLVKGSVTVAFDVLPPPTNVHINGVPWEGEGNKITLEPGDYSILFMAPGYRPHLERFTARKGESKSIKARLLKADKVSSSASATAEPAVTSAPPPPPEKPKGKGRVNVASKGGYCNVTIGGRGYGPTPVAGVEVPAGPVSVSCQVPGGPTLQSGATVVADQTARVFFTIPAGG